MMKIFPNTKSSNGGGRSHCSANYRNKGNFFFGLLCRKYDENKRAWRIRFNKVRCVVALFILFIIVWVGTSFCMWLAYKYVADYRDADFFQIASSPFNRQKHRRMMGEFNIREAKRLFAEGNYSSGFVNLQKGISRSPDNLEARVMLSVLYSTWFDNQEEASKILDMKLKKAFESKKSEYLKSAITIFAMSDEYRDKSVSLVSLCDSEALLSPDDLKKVLTSIIKKLKHENRYITIAKFCTALSEKTSNPEILNFIGSNGALAYVYLMDFKGANDILKKCGIYSGKVYLAVLYNKKIAEGKEVEAAKLANAAVKKLNESPEFYRLLSNCHDDFGSESEKIEAAKIADIMDGKTFVIDIANIKNSPSAMRKSMLDAYMKKYEKASSLPVIMLMSHLVSVRDEQSMEKCYESLVKGSPSDALTSKMMKAEFLIKERRIQDAIVELNSLKKIGDSFKGYSKSKYIKALGAFEIIIKAISGENVDERIVSFVDAHGEDSSGIYSFANFLFECGLDSQCAKVVKIASEKFPQDWRFNALNAKIYQRSSDTGAFVKFVAESKIRIPVKILAAMPENFDGDAFVFLSPDEKENAHKKVAEARKKLAEYKKYFGMKQ